jgi:hypothetical protein
MLASMSSDPIFHRLVCRIGCTCFTIIYTLSSIPPRLLTIEFKGSLATV